MTVFRLNNAYVWWLCSVHASRTVWESLQPDRHCIVASTSLPFNNLHVVNFYVNRPNSHNFSRVRRHQGAPLHTAVVCPTIYSFICVQLQHVLKLYGFELLSMQRLIVVQSDHRRHFGLKSGGYHLSLSPPFSLPSSFLSPPLPSPPLPFPSLFPTSPSPSP